MVWIDAATYCPAGWRLPTPTELPTIVDETMETPSLDESHSRVRRANPSGRPHRKPAAWTAALQPSRGTPPFTTATPTSIPATIQRTTNGGFVACAGMDHDAVKRRRRPCESDRDARRYGDTSRMSSIVRSAVQPPGRTIVVDVDALGAGSKSPASRCGGPLGRRRGEHGRARVHRGLRSGGQRERSPTSLAYEQTLIVYDAEKRREHFVREVVFSASREPFGFVVPTPARPEVAKVKKSPFPKLRDHSRSAGRIRSGWRGSPPPDGDSVEVLEVTRVGNSPPSCSARRMRPAFRAGSRRTVSSGRRGRRLARALRKARFFTSPCDTSPPRQQGQDDRRDHPYLIRFTAPLLSVPRTWSAGRQGLGGPAAPRDLARLHARLRSGRLASGRRATGCGLPGRIPLHATTFVRRSPPPSRLAVPAGPLQLQRFADQKRSRVGFGDVVFVPDGAGDGGPPPEALRGFAETLESPPTLGPRRRRRNLMAGQDASINATRRRDRSRTALRPGCRGIGSRPFGAASTRRPSTSSAATARRPAGSDVDDMGRDPALEALVTPRVELSSFDPAPPSLLTRAPARVSLVDQ